MSRLAINILVEKIYQLLIEIGYKVVVSIEVELKYGRVDIQITVTNYGLNLKDKAKDL
jgi:hypothetical protein